MSKARSSRSQLRGGTGSSSSRRGDVRKGRRRAARRGTRSYATTATHPARLRAVKMPVLGWRVTPAKAAAGGLFLLLLSLLVYIFASTDFYVWDIQVQDAKWVSVAEVWQASDLEGFSIFYIDPQEIEERLRTLPAVKGVHVQCTIPNRVVVSVEEREPLAIWQSQGVQFWVDEEGVLFPRRADLERPVIIVEQDGPARQVGERVEAGVVQAAGALASFLPEVSIFGYSRTAGIFFDLPNGQRVFTLPEREPAKVVAALEALQQKLQTEGIVAHELDLRYEQRVYWR